MQKFEPGDRVIYQDYGVLQIATVVKIKPSGIVYVRRIEGPLAGRMTWMHAESLAKEAA